MTRLVAVNLGLVAFVAVAVASVQAIARPEASLEASVRRYAQAISNADLDAAMAEIAPDQRSRWTDWVRGQLGNVYEVRGVAVRAPSVLRPPTDVTVVLDVNKAFPDEFYQPTANVTVEESNGRWYLSAPLLAST